MWYALAESLVRHLSEAFPERFHAFVLKACHEDCGEEAAMEEFQMSLGRCMEWILGPGEWAPKAG